MHDYFSWTCAQNRWSWSLPELHQNKHWIPGRSAVQQVFNGKPASRAMNVRCRIPSPSLNWTVQPICQTAVKTQQIPLSTRSFQRIRLLFQGELALEIPQSNVNNTILNSCWFQHSTYSVKWSPCLALQLFKWLAALGFSVYPFFFFCLKTQIIKK